MTPMAITATAPACPMASLQKPMTSGKMVPPKSPIIISPETSFCLSGTERWMLYTAIALVGYGNSNIFSICFAQALTSMPEKQNEVSGLMIMGLFGGTIFPLLMGFASDAIGQAGAVAIMAIGVIYLFTYIPRIKR